MIKSAAPKFSGIYEGLERDHVLVAIGMLEQMDDCLEGFRSASEYFLQFGPYVLSSKPALALAVGVKDYWAAVCSGTTEDSLKAYIPRSTAINGGDEVRRILTALGFSVKRLNRKKLLSALEDVPEKEEIS